MNLISKLLHTTAIGLGLVAAATADTQKPNVVLIFTDDLGYAQLSITGNEDYQTPHIDSIAQQGMMFNNGYVTAAICGPSRTGMLTGRYQQKLGREGNGKGTRLGVKTIANYLGELAYKSTAIGKWHDTKEDAYMPTNRGFDEFYGFNNGASKFIGLTSLTRGLEKEEVDPEAYATELFGDEALKFIDRNHKDPFFLYLAFNAPHGPFQALQKDLDRVAHLDKGIDGDIRQAVAAMVLNMDDQVGRVLAKLKEYDIDDNTIIFFLSDNGGVYVDNDCVPNAEHKRMNNGKFRMGKSTLYEGGVHVPFFIRWPAKIQPATTDVPVISLDIIPTVIAAAGGEIPAEAQLDGVDLNALLNGSASDLAPRSLFWKMDKYRYAIRTHDGWKLGQMPFKKIPRNQLNDIKDMPAELYNLNEDIGEMNNLIDQQPERAQAMWKELKAWLDSTDPQLSPVIPDSRFK